MGKVNLSDKVRIKLTSVQILDLNASNSSKIARVRRRLVRDREFGLTAAAVLKRRANLADY